MSAGDELAAIEREIASCTWNIDLLFDVMARLVEQRDALLAREAKARARDLRQAREFMGEVVER